MTVDDLRNIVLGIMGNAATSLIATYGRQLVQHVHAWYTTHRPIIFRSIAKLEDSQFRIFISSPEFDKCVRDLLALKIGRSGAEYDQYLDMLFEEFSFFFGIYEGNIDRNVEYYRDFFYEIEEHITELVNDLDLSAIHSDKSKEYIHNLIFDMRNNIKFLTNNKLDIKTFIDFETVYRQQVMSRFDHITPPFLKKSERIAIDNLYVHPRFTNIKQDHVFTFEDILPSMYRTVILGNPGGGKSTFVTKLCYDVAGRYIDRLVCGRQVTPIIVILREYGAAKKAKGYSILEFIEATCKSNFQLAPPQGAFEYVLTTGRAMVFFDGLDELLEINDRQEISRDIESFCNLYPSVPVLITSREVGYDQAPLAPSKFMVLKLADFDRNQIQQYVEKWFFLDVDASPDEKTKNIQNFIDESKVAPDLISNPLMLGLMCNVYSGDGYIPRNKPELYRKCSDMLFEHWDKQRKIIVPLSSESHLRVIFMHIANLIYSKPRFASGITESQLISLVSEYLHNKQFPIQADAIKAAEEVINFCTGRAWVFTDTGTTHTEERLYQFTHRTFLEYFTAFHLTRIHSVETLSEILFNRIIKGEWEVVCQLAVHIKHGATEDAGDTIINYFINNIRVSDYNTAVLAINFCIKCIEFISLRSDTIDSIIRLLIELVIEFKSIRKTVLNPMFFSKKILNSPAGNSNSVEVALKKYFVVVFNRKHNQDLIPLFELIYTVYWPDIKALKNIINEFKTVDYNKYISFNQKYFGPWVRISNLMSSIDNHGLISLFYNYEYITTNRTDLSRFNSILRYITKNKTITSQVYDYIIQNKTPLISINQIEDFEKLTKHNPFKLSLYSRFNMDIKLTQNEYFVLFYLSAIYCELSHFYNRHPLKAINEIKKSLPREIIQILKERLNVQDIADGNMLFKDIAIFNEGHKNTIMEWVTHKINFVEIELPDSYVIDSSTLYQGEETDINI